MKKALYIAVISALISPATASAAWWNPFSWSPRSAATSTEAIATSTATTTAEATIAALQARVAELESALQAALATALAAERKASAPAATKAQAKTTGLSAREISDRLSVSLAKVETSRGAYPGVALNTRGDILVDARAVLTKDSAGNGNGAVGTAAVTLSGAKHEAEVVGFDEIRGVAFVRVAGEKTVTVARSSGAQAGAIVFILSVPGTDPVEGTLSQKGKGWIEISTTDKLGAPGDIVVDGSGALLGIVTGSSCKVVEDGSRCLAHRVTASDTFESLSKVAEGMRLYKTKKGTTTTEILVRGKLEGARSTYERSPSVEGAISYIVENPFDAFNARLANDDNGKVTKLYLNKLKLSAEALYRAYDSLENQAHDLSVFFVNEETNVETLGGYQRKELARISAFNAAKLKEFRDQAAYWTKKKNEYDTRLTRPAETSHDYLLTESLVIEEAVEDLEATQKALIEAVPQETIALF